MDSSKSIVFAAQVLIKGLDLYDYFINSQGSLRCLCLPCGLVVEPSGRVLCAVLRGFLGTALVGLLSMWVPCGKAGGTHSSAIPDVS